MFFLQPPPRLLLLLRLSAASALLSVDQPLDRVDAGLRTSAGELLALSSVHVRGEVLDVIARCTLLQEYHNPYDTAIEAKYVFPLDETAAVCGFEAYINDKHIVGQVKEKAEARREYKAAVEAGHGAYLMDEEAPNVFTVSVGNLPPRARVIIKITFVMELGTDGDLLVFRLPNAVAPDARDAAADALTQSTVDTVAALDEAGALASGFSLELALTMPTEIRSLVCRSHPDLAQIKATATLATVRLAGVSRLGAGFVLDIALAEAHAPRLWVQENDRGERACMLALTPELGLPASVPCFHLLLDLSCSMADTLEDARQLAALALHLLPAGARFNVSVFGDVLDSCFQDYMRVSAATRQAAGSFLAGADATLGSTNLAHAWRALSLLEPPVDNDRPPTAVLLLTDMRVPNAETLLAAAAGASSGPRVFGVGCGASCQRAVLASFCRHTGGQAVFPDAARRSTWQHLLQQQMEAACQPSLTNVAVCWCCWSRQRDVRGGMESERGREVEWLEAVRGSGFGEWVSALSERMKAVGDWCG